MATGNKTSQGTGQTQTTALRLKPKHQLELSRLIMLSPAELAQDIEKQLIENPALEAKPAEDDKPSKDRAEDRGEGDYWDADENPNIDADDVPYRGYGGSGRPTYEPRDDDTQTIIDHLREQLLARPLTPTQSTIIDNIIGNLDSRGYLKRDVYRIADDMAGEGVTTAEVVDMANLVRSLDPPGIAAIDLTDCLLLQLERMPESDDVNMAYDIVAKHSVELADGRLQSIADALDTTADEVKRVINDVLTRLNPEPAAGYASPDEGVNPYIEPQYIIEIDNETDTIVATVNSRFPELQVSQSYTAGAAADTGSKTATSLERQRRKTLRETIRKNIDAAEFYIKMIKMRQQTMSGILDCIVRRQRDYILSGNRADLHPMVLDDIAGQLGVDTSTVSRATSDQYVQMPGGNVMPMRSFFVTEGDNIKPVLRELIEGEDPGAPLTDDRLAAILRERGFKVERRTVVKYRDKLGIASSRHRHQSEKQ